MVSYGDIVLPRRKGLKKWACSALKTETPDAIAVENCLGGGCREDRARILLEVQSDELRRNRPKLQQGKFQSGFRGHRNSSQWGQANTTACSSERLEISILGNCKNVSEQGLNKLFWIWPCFDHGSGLESFKRSCLTYTILQFWLILIPQLDYL